MTTIVSLAYEVGLPICADALARDHIARFPQPRGTAAGPSPRSLLGELSRFGPSPARALQLLERLSPEARGHAAADLADRLVLTTSDDALRSTLIRAHDRSVETMLAPNAVASLDPSTGDVLARLLANAHLPRLACAVLPPDALDTAAEILLDAELFDALPDAATLVGEGTAADLELAGYAAARAELQTNAAEIAARIDAEADFDYSRTSAAEIRRFARTHLVRAELSFGLGRASVPFDALDYIAREHPRWRYAQRVLILAALQATRVQPACELLDGYLDRFGNDALLWRSLLGNIDVHSPAYDRMRARLVAEAMASPRDLVVWRALVDTLNAPAAAQELERCVAWRVKLLS